MMGIVTICVAILSGAYLVLNPQTHVLWLRFFFFSSRRRHTRFKCDWSSDVCSSDLGRPFEESRWFDAELRRQLLEWAAVRVRHEFSELVWQAFWRTGVEGQSAQSAARALGLTIGTVYQYRSRVVVGLRREVEPVDGGTKGR